MTALEEVAANSLGSVLGFVVALAAFPPRTRRGFIRRLAVSLPTGIVFGWVPPLLVYFPENTEGEVAAGFAASFAAWWAVGFVKRKVLPKLMDPD